MLIKVSDRSVARRSQTGFTIVELMIATLIFSVILLVITAGVIHFTTDYYKGVNSSSTQDTARSITDTVSQAIQFGGTGSSPQACANLSNPPLKGAVLIGNEEFIYVLNQEVGSGGSQTYTLYEMPANNAQCVQASDLTGDLNSGNPAGRELLGPHMRLISFSVDNNDGGDLWTVSVGVAYGGDDLFCSPAQGNCGTNQATRFNQLVPDLLCRSQAGSQFCDVSTLTTTVQQRVQ